MFLGQTPEVHKDMLAEDRDNTRDCYTYTGSIKK